MGAHSDEHLLYADWKKRDSLLVTESEFKTDLLNNYAELKRFGAKKKNAVYFLPPFEWYNDTISAWTKEMDLQLINYTPGTLSHTDYTTPDAKNYRSSASIYQSIIDHEKTKNLNGFILLLHIGTDPTRKDKFYSHLQELLKWLKSKNYIPQRIDELLKF